MLGTESCTDHPGFKDKFGTTCAHTRDFGNCKDGKAERWDEEQLRKDANVEGVSSLDACCVCGGGNRKVKVIL